MSLRFRSSLYFTAVVVLVLAAALAFFYRSQRAEISSQVLARHRQVMADLVKVAEEAFLSREDVPLLNFIRTLSQSPDVSVVEIVSDDGRLLAAADPSRIGSRESAVREGPYTYAVPIVAGARRVGVARLAFDPGAIQRRAARSLGTSMRRFTASVVSASLALGLLAAFVFSYGLTRPIQQLVAGARRIGEGRLEHRIPVKASDEIGELAREFNQMAARLSELDELKQDFVHSITHDLRSPISSIMGYGELLEGTSLSDEQRRSLDQMTGASRELLELVDAILDTAALEAGVMKLNASAQDLCRIVQEVHEMFLAVAKRRNVGLTLALKSSTAPVRVDRALMKRVIENLVSNALKFTPEQGMVTMEVGQRGAGFYCGVADTGPGIPLEHQSRLFQKFSQVPGSKSSAGRGSGLGLAICKLTVEAHGGRVGVESQPGRGALFYFVIPIGAQPC